ncbi:MAG: hypothetical protein EON91_12560 [Brevundimonas sp.]|uniref:porin n=1 Tax=Brevundimonas sp. TaxID=1871086 RepID=UPI0012099EE3|nr:porin [Brevundimonas sp.]RZJ16599.1 MAG: hypothetical protein EON91_12560 [Brevundimonas sp.]
MKTLFLATAAVAALLAAPAAAQNVGSIGLTYANTEVSYDGDDADSDAWAVDGTVAMPAFGDWTVTLDGAVTRSDTFGEDAESLSGAVHLTKMISSDLRAGGFVAADDAGIDLAWTVGAEVQKYMGNATLSGSLAYTTLDSFGADLDAWTIGGEAAYYVMPNVRLSAALSYSDLEFMDESEDALTYGVAGEYEFASTPISIRAGYSRTDFADIEADTWTIGLRYNFGGGMQARERAGANLPGATGLLNLLGGAS